MKDRAFLFILGTLLIDALGVGIVFPIMPDLMVRVGAVSTAEGSLWAALLMSSYAGAMFLFGPAVGSLSDAVGRKPVLLASLALLALDYILMALAGTFWLLLVGRVLAGMAGSTYITATAFIADISTPENKAARFGKIGAAYGLGFVLGPALGGAAAGIDTAAPFWIAAALAAANLLFGVMVLPESLSQENRRPFGRQEANPFRQIGAAFHVPGLGAPLLVLFVFEFANMAYPTLWAFWTREVFGWSAALIGVSFAAYGLLLASVQGGLMPVLIRQLGEFRVLVLGLVAAVIAMIGFGFTTTVIGLAVFLVLAVLSDLTPPVLTALVSNRVDDNRQGQVQGVIASLGSVSFVVAPLILTLVFERFSDGEGPIYLPGAPFLLSALMILAVVPLAWRLGRNSDLSLDR